MLTLKHITKEYTAGDTSVEALKGIDLSFRRNEFVSVLGPSGCGKTTLLNIIGGLDRYTTGDLLIGGRSTKEFRDADWDTYRNHSIGFVFQSYNLIPHQTVLQNVELALTLSGVSKTERRKRAIQVLEKVGLGDQLHKRPNQMSGGQMQRVAIARALVNDPEILLADEPTGALDSETSVQIMELLKQIASDRLVIMVTHNPELAERYSTRIVRLLDGRVVSDSHPYAGETQRQPQKQKGKGKASMHFWTALSLSFNNLRTKKGRTLLTSFAGSIGIIGIALILALSSGARAYIARVEEDTLANYPITLEQSTMDLAGMMTSFLGSTDAQEFADDGSIHANTMMQNMLQAMSQQQEQNDLAAFKQYLEEDPDGMGAYLSDIQYSYTTPLNLYQADTSNGIVQVNPSQVFTELGMGTMTEMASSMSAMSEMGGSVDAWSRLSDNTELLEVQYDVLAGRLPTAWNEAVIVADQDGRVSDYTLYTLGLLDTDDLRTMLDTIMEGGEVTSEPVSYTYDELLSLSFKLLKQTDYYQQTESGWQDMREDAVFMEQALAEAEEIKIVGVLKVSEDAVSSTNARRGFVGYRSDLMEHLVEEVNASAIVAAQQADPETDVFTGKPFRGTDSAEEQPFDPSTLSAEQQAYLASLSETERAALIAQYQAQSVSSATYEGNLQTLGVADLDAPDAIHLYPIDFEAKESVAALIDAYNDRMEQADELGKRLQYTDYVGLMMSSITTIINAISYILIAFVGISLVVSSIMIGIITYISVLERTKEIGVLRSIGASKRDVSRVFNAETLIIGFTAGVLGIGVTLLLVLLANSILKGITGLANLAALPWEGALILVGISMALTLIAGLIPARLAAKKDPVVALRSE
jgi:putative ABC transport system permease protein